MRDIILVTTFDHRSSLDGSSGAENNCNSRQNSYSVSCNFTHNFRFWLASYDGCGSV